MVLAEPSMRSARAKVALDELATREVARLEEILEVGDRRFEDFLTVAERHSKGTARLDRGLDCALLVPDSGSRREWREGAQQREASERGTHLAGVKANETKRERSSSSVQQI